MNANYSATIVILTALNGLAGVRAATAQSMEELAELEQAAHRQTEFERRAGKLDETNTTLAFHEPNGTYQELAFVLNGFPVYRKSSNRAEATIIKAESAKQEFSVWGQDITVGLWDNGRPYAHPEFADRLHVADQPGSFPHSSHSTHVAGTLIASGLDPEATGIASEASVVAYDWKFDYIEMWSEAHNGLRVSNHSYNYAYGWEKTFKDGAFGWTYRSNNDAFGQYGVTPWFWDQTMSENPYYLAVQASGNEAGQGPASPESTPHYHNSNLHTLQFDDHPIDCGTDFACLGPLATAKNSLVVGALDENGVGLADYSSRGPTLDGRIKPDIVSIGSGVYSTVGHDRYSVSSGTSMATPTVAGSVALMIDLEKRLFGEEGKLRSSTLKALLIHGADDLGNPGPDYQFGWGRVNVERTLELMVASTGPTVAVIESDIEDEVSFSFFATGSKLKATLAWIDPIGPSPNTIRDKSTPVLVEDVDLTVEQAGTIYRPFVLDPLQPDKPATTGDNTLDNVEQVRLAVSRPVPVRVVVRRKSGSTEPIRVSLVVSGISKHPVPTGTTSDQIGQYPSMVVFPNPARIGSEVRLEGVPLTAQTVQIDLIDVAGRVVSSREQVHPQDAGIRVPDWVASGLYFVRTRSESIEQTASIAVIR